MGVDTLDYCCPAKEADWAAWRAGDCFRPVQPWPGAGWRVYDNLLRREIGGAFYGRDAEKECREACERLNEAQRRERAAKAKKEMVD